MPVGKLLQFDTVLRALELVAKIFGERADGDPFSSTHRNSFGTRRHPSSAIHPHQPLSRQRGLCLALYLHHDSPHDLDSAFDLAHRVGASPATESAIPP